MNWLLDSFIANFIKEHWLAINLISLVMLVASIAVTITVLLSLPHNYWLKKNRRRASWPESIIRNIIAFVLFFLGFLLLFLPGQGLLTLLVAIIIADLPFKKKWTQYFIKRPKVRQAMNLIRKKFGRREFIWP